MLLKKLYGFKRFKEKDLLMILFSVKEITFGSFDISQNIIDDLSTLINLEKKIISERKNEYEINFKLGTTGEIY
ncbi:hypothetical protein BCR32DRAFT_285785 [Anaeromyces robustus]|uniref:Uncharacterized protein n=1 Tax=Anaeromyces robustus TaxID=1754192 RepID=A0A1Y1WE02_9FUNG|nr:hypothetical protein BCR32DRAFT_285785 [Anaeromyces robustus]|eukprot:ORX71750.1 hypothetical protein BCR32DRAFT_285785 [Anaeromyces robustus]